MDISFREIKSNQIKEYQEFLRIGLLNDEDNFRITPLDDLNSNFPTKDTDDSFTIGAYYENKLAGNVSFSRDGADRQKLRHKGILFRMYVSPALRGQGIAKRLIELVIDKALLLDNMEQINLTVIATNDKARILYEKLGFVSYGQEQKAIKWKDKYFDEELMSLKLR
ncbi:MAG: GNAT family N-acetyltransferase [Chitinophagaceae bacterium]